MTSSRFRVIYDEQCEICQAGVSWLKFLDRDRRVACHPIEPDLLSTLHPDLIVEACLRELQFYPEVRVRPNTIATTILIT
jgi:hypothetical protein